MLVLSKSNTWRMCTIVDTDDSRVKVHYDGFDPVYDEWVDKLSSRIKPAEEGRSSARTALLKDFNRAKGS